MRSNIAMLVASSLVAHCGATYPNSSIEGRWTADVRLQMAEELAANFTSYTVVLSFNRDGTYSFEARVVLAAGAALHPACTMTQESRGTWSTDRSGTYPIVSATATAGTIERAGCRDASDNLARRAALESELLELRSASYNTNGSVLVLRPTPVLYLLQLQR
ncbi:MAG: hypothetical protein JNK05_20850 [Myxococcales bacterium]|nr:hypothetical protein [Myxococcales bacterium]